MSRLLLWRKNCFLDSIYYCPYHETFGLGNYKKDSDDRKPNPGMILKAQKDHNINLKESFLIGDKESDIIAGIRAGITNIFHVKTGHGEREGQELIRNLENNLLDLNKSNLKCSLFMSSFF